MILDNGTVLTMDPALPHAGALAIAGEHIAGGVGTHETALAGPDRVDLGRRCVLPGFTDSHVHFLLWTLRQEEVRLEGTRSLEEAVSRVAEAVQAAPRGAWLRGAGWRSGEWSPPVEPTKEALDAVSPDTPVALMARDGHSLWLNSAALAAADGDLAVPGGVVEVDDRGDPTGVLREESAWLFRRRYVFERIPNDEWRALLRPALKLAAERGVTAIHDKDGWLGALGLRHRIEHAQLLSAEDVPRFARLGITASVQFSHAPSDRDLADRFWAGMTERAYPYRSLWDAGALVVNGSDAPVEELDPLAGVCAGVLRTLDERPAWHPEQTLSVEQALQATTVNPAWLTGDERRRGKLLPGYLADLVVLDRDPLACQPEELPEIGVVATMVGGRWTHNPPPWD